MGMDTWPPLAGWRQQLYIANPDGSSSPAGNDAPPVKAHS